MPVRVAEVRAQPDCGWSYRADYTGRPGVNGAGRATTGSCGPSGIWAICTKIFPGFANVRPTWAAAAEVK